ncbi:MULTISPECIES: YbjN domain-containing protein [Sphingomonas]|jgi:hypothetical protein
MIRLSTLFVLAAATLPVAAQAADDKERLLDLRQPPVVVQALQDAGYKAELKTNKAGEPYVLSGANGSSFTIEFYGCTGVKDCNSYQFSSWYKAEPLFTPELANAWNVSKRFLKVSVGKDGSLNEWMDFSAVGKTTFANFADIVDWYQTMDADLTKFLDEKRAAAKK